MTTIAVVNLKGGVGKTTSALHLAACASGEDRRVTVIDCDVERSAMRWASHAGEIGFDVVAGERNGLARQVRALEADKRRVVLLDAPPNDRELLVRAVNLSRTCLVPVGCTGLDVDRLGPTLELLRDLEAERGRLDVAILMTGWNGRTVLARETADALKGFPVLKTKIRQLERYAQAFGTRPTYLDEYRDAWRELKP
jgi:chromosome partitioning protein